MTFLLGMVFKKFWKTKKEDDRRKRKLIYCRKLKKNKKVTKETDKS